jgi:hypothetical protein
MGLIEYQAMPSFRDVAHNGWLCTFNLGIGAFLNARYSLLLISNEFCVLTINVPVVYMARDGMILMGENSFRGPLEGVGPENRDFFWP